jgi:type I restriction enzyme S subunit
VIADLKPYPAYEDSGVEWLGKVPEGWKMLPLGSGFRSSLKRNVGMQERTVLSLSYGRIVVKAEDDLRGLSPESFETYQLVDPGDIILRTTDLQNDQTSLRVGRAETKGIITAAYLRLVPRRNLVPGFDFLLLHAYDVMKVFYGYGSGLRQTLDFHQLKRILFALPPAAEQAAIVRFVAAIDTRVRLFIAAKKRLIDLLTEEKQAIVHRAITGGLDASAPVKPSGIEWLGDVPAHWQIKPLRYLARFHNGFAFKPADWGSDGTAIIRIANLNGSEEFNYTSRENVPEKLRIRRGDLLFAWSGNRGTSFGSFVWDRDFDGYLNQHIFKVDGFDLEPTYFGHLLRAVTKHVEEQAHGISGLVHVTKSKLGSIRVPVAPPDEQGMIARAIDEEMGKVSAIQSRARREISLIREYRTRLVADVVTGKLDVREAAANLATDPDLDLDEVVPDEQLEGAAA